MNFFELTNSIYKKTKPSTDIIFDTQLCITLNKWLGFDKENISIIKNILSFMFYLSPQHYFYLLYFSIPKKYNIPYLKKIPKITKKENQLLNKIKYILGWSNRELEFNRPILEKTILKNEKYWKQELGVK